MEYIIERNWSIAHILGKGHGWEKIKDILDELKEARGVIYGVNDAFLRTPEVDVTVHCHDLAKFLAKKDTHSSTKLTIKRANDNPEMEFISIYPYHKIKTCKEFPIVEVSKFFNLPVAYYTSGIEYMIAYAMWRAEQEGQPLKEMNYYGCNMTVKDEYKEQKPGMEFWTGMAMGRGVKVNFQLYNTSLLKTKDGLLYGYNIRQFRL